MGLRHSAGKKKKIWLQGFTDEEQYDETHWYNRAWHDVWDEDVCGLCAICGFQHHDPKNCPSPLKMRQELDGTLDEKWK